MGAGRCDRFGPQRLFIPTPWRGGPVPPIHRTREKVSRAVLDMDFRRSPVAVTDAEHGAVVAAARPFLAGAVHQFGHPAAAIVRLKVGGFPQGAPPARILVPALGGHDADQVPPVEHPETALIGGFGAAVQPVLPGVPGLVFVGDG